MITGVTLAAFRMADALPVTALEPGGGAPTAVDPSEQPLPIDPATIPPPLTSEPNSPPLPPLDLASRRSALLPLPVDEWPLSPQQSTTRPDELSPTNGTIEVKSLVDARAALAAEFSNFSAGGERRFRVDYQLARDMHYNTVLIGIVKIADYNGWLDAVRDHPEALRNWLQAAAERVKPAAEKEKFNLTWTIFEVVPESPFGFLSREVTAMPRGEGYLVTRPLAAVVDIAQSSVEISKTGLNGPQTATTSPWSVYGPVLRFDTTDLYRPAPRATGQN